MNKQKIRDILNDMQKNKGNIIFLVWLLLFSTNLLLTDWLEIKHNLSFIWFYNASYWLFPIILLSMENSFFIKALLSLFLGIWMLFLLFIAEILYNSPLLYIDFGQIGEPIIAWLGPFFFLWCIFISVICFVINTIIKKKGK